MFSYYLDVKFIIPTSLSIQLCTSISTSDADTDRTLGMGSLPLLPLGVLPGECILGSVWPADILRPICVTRQINTLWPRNNQFISRYFISCQHVKISQENSLHLVAVRTAYFMIQIYSHRLCKIEFYLKVFLKHFIF